MYGGIRVVFGVAAAYLESISSVSGKYPGRVCMVLAACFQITLNKAGVDLQGEINQKLACLEPVSVLHAVVSISGRFGLWGELGACRRAGRGLLP